MFLKSLTRASLLLVVVAFLAAGSGPAQSRGLSPLISPRPLPTLSNFDAVPDSSGRGPIGSDTVPLSSGLLGPWLPRIPELEVGFLWSIGPTLSTGRAIADYLLPLRWGGDSILFGQAHGEFQDFWKKPSVPGASVANYRTDLSFGGGFRKIFGGSTLIGINSFYDTSKLFGQWRSSGGVGLEMSGIGPGNSLVDLNFNYYGNIFNSQGLRNAFLNQGGSWDIESAVSQPLFNEAFDLRLKFIGYHFNTGGSVYGWRAGADLTSRCNMFKVQYEHGHDRVNGSYNTIGASVNVGIQLENILSGESPITKPQPIFGSPRHFWWLLTRKVKRDWHQGINTVLSRTSGGPIVRFISDTGSHFCTDGYFVPWDGGVGVSPQDLAGISRIEITGYTFVGEFCGGTTVTTFISNGSVNSTEGHVIYSSGQVGPPLDFLTAAAEFAGLNLSAEGIFFQGTGECECDYRIINLVVTFYP